MSQNSNIFFGENAHMDFLNPSVDTNTPLVELPRELNELVDDGVRVFAKVAFLSPLLNIKHLSAWNLLKQAKEDGLLEGVDTLVENSSGNMALGISVLAKKFGIKNVVVVVPRDIPPGKLEMLRLFGADIEFHNAVPGGISGVAYAKELGKRKGWLNLGQYENEANPKAYEKYFAPQIWEQTQKKLSVFCTGLGTTGTLLGAHSYFKKQSPNIAVVGVVPRHDSVPGVRSVRRLKEVSFAWEDRQDYSAEVETKDAFKTSLALCRLGILAGPSSGMALSGLMQTLKKQKDLSNLDKFRNTDGEVIAVFVCPDSALLYLEKYSTHLNPEDF